MRRNGKLKTKTQINSSKRKKYPAFKDPELVSGFLTLSVFDSKAHFKSRKEKNNRPLCFSKECFLNTV
jgi:hypothetical protein